MIQRCQAITWAALVAQIPFELKYTLLGLSNLQWTFIALVAVNVPSFYVHRQKLMRDRLVQAAALFVAIQWVSAYFAPEFTGNAVKGAIRFTAAATLLAMAKLLPDWRPIQRIWAVASFCAAVYALCAQAGLGLPWLFRNGEFFVAQIQRLSGSFEYPNIAAAYYAMSLPLVWWAPFRTVFRWIAAVVLSCALILTFSRSAAAAVTIVSIAMAVLAWRKGERWRMHAGLIGAGIGAFAILTIITPYLTEVFQRSAAGTPRAAEYSLDWNLLREAPDLPDMVRLTIRNTGTIPWFSNGFGHVAIGYRWRNMETAQVDNGRFVTALPHDVQPDEAIELPVSFQTPARPGKYRLLIELFAGKSDWFGNAGVRPAVIDADIQPGISRTTESVEAPYAPRVERKAGVRLESVSRTQLWTAAVRMFREHPFGVGPDNYRLLYGRFIGADSWNTNIYSNNLYLELLAGSGMLGLAAFSLIVACIPHREATPPLMAVAVFLIHGFLDVFLMTTPIYFSFWILAGLCRDE